MIRYLGLALLSGLLAYGLTPLVRRTAIRLGAVDHPDARKVHLRQIPRLGGVAVAAAAGLTLALAALFDRFYAPFFQLDLARWGGLWLGMIPVVAAGVWDDIRPLKAVPKFALQGLGAGIAIWSGFLIEGIGLGPEYALDLGALAYLVTLLWIVGVTNAFNLIDGLDGLAGGMALIAAAALAGITFLNGDTQTALLLAVLCGALLGFLPYNFHPARIFLGDSGSLVLGFVLSLVAIRSAQKGATFVAVLVPLLVLGIPLFDTLVAIARRFLRAVEGGLREGGGFRDRLAEVFQADRGHLHHVLLRKGFSHRGTVLILYGLGVLLAAGAFVVVFARDINAGLLLALLILGTVIGIRKLQHPEFQIVRSGLAIRTLSLPLFSRLFFQVFVDAALVAGAYYGAFLLKTEVWSLGSLKTAFLQTLPLVLTVKVGALVLFGVYRGVWRYTNLAGLFRLGQAIAVGCLAAALLITTFYSYPISPALFVIDLVLLAVVLGGSRVSFRMLEHLQQQARADTRRALIYGAGKGGALILQECLQNADLCMSPVGFLDDDAHKRGRVLNGYPIFGTLERLSEIIQEHRVTDLLIASEKIGEDQVDRARALCAQWGVRLHRCQVAIQEEGIKGARD